MNLRLHLWGSPMDWQPPTYGADVNLDPQRHLWGSRRAPSPQLWGRD